MIAALLIAVCASFQDCPEPRELEMYYGRDADVQCQQALDDVRIQLRVKAPKAIVHLQCVTDAG